MTGPDTILLPHWLVPVVPGGSVQTGQAVVLAGNRIHAVMDAGQARRQWPEAELVDLPGHALIPGLINMHTHASMSLLKGFADDMRLDVWLKEHVWPAEQRWIEPDYIGDASNLALLEMLKAGITCFNDNYFFPDVTAEKARAAGLRAIVGIPIIDFPTAWADTEDRYFERGMALYRRWRDDPLISTSLAPHAPYTVTDRQLERIRQLSEAHAIPVHIHLLESRPEIDQSLAQHGLRPLQRLDRLGLLSPRLLAVHMTALDEADFELLADRGVHVIHCPESNLKLASGMCPVHRLQQHGVNVAVGTDGVASNNDLDLLTELRTAALLAKGVASDPQAVTAEQALNMVTINAARALGLNEQLGSIEAGKQADLCALDLSGPATQPVHQVISQIVYACNREQVSDVWVAGRRLLQDRQATSLNETTILERAAGWQNRIANGATA